MLVRCGLCFQPESSPQNRNVLVPVDDGMRSWRALISYIFAESVMFCFERLHSIRIHHHLGQPYVSGQKPDTCEVCKGSGSVSGSVLQRILRHTVVTMNSEGTTCNAEAVHKWTRIGTSAEKGIRTFRSSVFSILGAKVPTENFRSRERKFAGTFTPGNESSRELLLLGAKVLGNFRSRDSQFTFFSDKYSLLMIITLIPRRRRTIHAGSINSFKNRLQKLRQMKIGLFMDSPSPKASLVPGSPGTGAATPGKLPGMLQKVFTVGLR